MGQFLADLTDTGTFLEDPNAVLQIRIELMRIRIKLFSPTRLPIWPFTLMRIRIRLFYAGSDHHHPDAALHNWPSHPPRLCCEPPWLHYEPPRIHLRASGLQGEPLWFQVSIYSSQLPASRFDAGPGSGFSLWCGSGYGFQKFLIRIRNSVLMLHGHFFAKMQRFRSWNLPAFLINFVMLGPETTACMAVVAQAVRAVVPRTIPVGIQILGEQ